MSSRQTLILAIARLAAGRHRKGDSKKFNVHKILLFLIVAEQVIRWNKIDGFTITN